LDVSDTATIELPVPLYADVMELGVFVAPFRTGEPMKKTSFVLLCIAATLVAYWRFLLFPSWTFRYQLTIDVAVGDETKSGSGVIEKTWLDGANFPLMHGRWNSTTRGEAISVDLGPRGRLFALLSQTGTPLPIMGRYDPVEIVRENFAPVFGHVTVMNESEMWAYRPPREAVDVPTILLPMLVRFRDIDDPKTVEQVDPSDLASSFGPDVKLARAAVQIVPSGFWPFNRFNVPFPQWLFGEPITTGIEKQLPPWYARLERLAKSKYHDASLAGKVDGMHFPSESLANTLSTLSFAE
jgi:hypothetical protein